MERQIDTLLILLIARFKGMEEKRAKFHLTLWGYIHIIIAIWLNGENILRPPGRKTNMRKATIKLTDEQYFFLKEKALELQKQNLNASIVSIIRNLIQKNRQE